MNIILGVNIDHIATLRQARKEHYPSVLKAAFWAVEAGAQSITAHLREDRRHIQDQDIELLKSGLDSIGTPLNLEMAATKEMLSIAKSIKPHAVCLVPEKREELTTEGGLNLFSKTEFIQECIRELQEEGIQVSLFLDPEIKILEHAFFELCPDAIELHTGTYAKAFLKGNAKESLEKIKECILWNQELQARYEKNPIKLHAGHGLTLQNLPLLVKHCPEIVEYNIGHALIADALFLGLKKSTQAYLSILHQAHSPLVPKMDS